MPYVVRKCSHSTLLLYIHTPHACSTKKIAKIYKIHALSKIDTTPHGAFLYKTLLYSIFPKIWPVQVHQCRVLPYYRKTVAILLISTKEIGPSIFPMLVYNNRNFGQICSYARKFEKMLASCASKLLP